MACRTVYQIGSPTQNRKERFFKTGSYVALSQSCYWNIAGCGYAVLDRFFVFKFPKSITPETRKRIFRMERFAGRSEIRKEFLQLGLQIGI